MQVSSLHCDSPSAIALHGSKFQITRSQLWGWLLHPFTFETALLIQKQAVGLYSQVLSWLRQFLGVAIIPT